MRRLIPTFLALLLAVSVANGTSTLLPRVDCGTEVKTKLNLVESLPQGCETEKQELRSLCSVALNSCKSKSPAHLQAIYQKMDEAAVLVAQCLGE